MKKIILSIGGMTCSACSNGLEKYLNKQEGIVEAKVNLVLSCVSINYDDNISLSDIERFIQEAGFKSLGEMSLNDEKKESYLPLVLYGIFAIFIMYISMGHMLGFPSINMEKYPNLYCIILLFFTLIFLVYGFDIIDSGFKNLIHRMPNMDSLVMIGVIASFIYSLVNTIFVLMGNISYVDKMYYESCVFVIYFIKLGRYIENNALYLTVSSIRKLVMITPTSAKIKNGNSYKEVTIDEVKKGDILVCYPNEKIAVDGAVVSGSSYFDESFITGESMPVSKNVNDRVVAGSINYDSKIEYMAEKIGKDSTISEIIKLVVEGVNSKTRITKLVDKISNVFVPIIILISIIVFLVYLFMGNSLYISIERFISVLVVACPCSLGLATPIAIVLAVGICSENGIFIKSSETFEISSNIDTIVFDKTGTLTNGKLCVSKFYNYSDIKDNDFLKILGSLESCSSHPIAKGILKYIDDKNIKYNKCECKNIENYGVKLVINDVSYYAGSYKLLNKLNIKNNHLDDEKKLLDDKNSVVYFIMDDKIIGLLGLKDTIRLEAKETINKLYNLGIDVVMLTGDNDEVSRDVGDKLNIKNIISNATPKDKSNYINKLKKNRKKVMMVGDGINDAVALTFADVGVSIGSGTDVASMSSDIIITTDNLNEIINLLKISNKTINNIKGNLFWAFIYNIVMIVIATGLLSKFVSINPMIASISMVLSSLFVVGNALRLKKIKL